MDEYRENVKKVQKALHQDAAFLRPDPYLAQRVLKAADRKSGAVLKKRVALVIVIVLLLSGIVAVAATLLWREYVPQIKQSEHTLGDYAQWPASRRIQLAKDIFAMGYLEASDDTRILSGTAFNEQDKAAAADRLMLKLTGQEDVKEIHSTLITYAIMGNEDTWTPKQRVWWNGIMAMYADTGAPDTPLVPTEENLSEAAAIDIGRAAIQDAYGFDDAYMADLHPVANLYVTEQRPDYRRWDIQFRKYREGSDSYLERVYSVVVDENGEVISDPDVGIEHPSERAARANAKTTEAPNAGETAISKIYEQYGSQVEGRSIWNLSLEEKASVLGGDNGLPKEGEIAESEAVQIARDRLNSIGYELTSYEVSVWYNVNSSRTVDHSGDGPFYTVYFLDDMEVPEKAFSVTVDATTGDVLATYTRGSIPLE